MVLVAIQLSVPGRYLPPVFRKPCRHPRPRRSFHCRSRLPCEGYRAEGALVVLVAVQLSVLGLYLPPVFKGSEYQRIHPKRSFHCRSRLPCAFLVQRARWWCWWLSNYRCWDCISRRYSNRAAAPSTPNDHFTAGPDCRVKDSGRGDISSARGRPPIIGARNITGVGNFRKSVDNLP